MKNFTITDHIQIAAPKEKVWEVLTTPEFMKQWDELPENYSGGNLQLNSTIEWEGYSKLTVTDFKENEILKLNMYLPKLSLDPSQYDVSYTYRLTESNGITTLNFEIGDFSPLPDPQNYMDATLEFVHGAKEKIKELAENSR
ncbi:MAG TPA: SRPBCC domain-containing protein [Bacteroidia bacterium]|nr:SRPBCC domain-containing protein [Bacteroidia bacterium]